jgi:hypothetical protein
MAELHDFLYCYVDGNLLSDNQEVTTAIVASITEVETTTGWKGISPGGPKRTVECKGVVPIKGFEFDAEKALINSTEITIRLQFGTSGKSTTTKGFIMSTGFSTGVGKVTEQNWTFVGEPSEFA